MLSMTELKSSSKGFNLFTPLVGTALVIMAILIATGMMQNDVRISRTIISSYEISSQSIAAKAIKAATEVRIISNIESALYKLLNGEYGSEFEITCSNEAGCISAVESVFTNPHGTFMTVMTTGADGMYNGVIDSINTVSGYITSATDSDLSAALATVSNAGKSVVTVEFPNDFVEAMINEKDIQTYAGNALRISFQDAQQNRMVVSIVPQNFTYRTTEPILKMIKATAEAFKDGLSKDTFEKRTGADLTIWPYYKDYDSCFDSSKKRVKTEWKLDNGDVFKLTFKTTDSC